MSTQIRRVVIVGGGTAGWMSAALLKKIVGKAVSVQLVQSEAIGTVGVGEATIPPIRLLNQVLGLNEAEFIKQTQATIKLGIMFEGWRVPEERYFHSFGAPGKNMAFCQFHHYCTKAQQLGDDTNIWDYDLNYLCAMQGKFAHINSQDPILELPYAYHFDASLYAKFLRKISENLGVVRTEGLIERVEQHDKNGDVKQLILKSGQVIQGDLFIDCSGFRGLLIQQTLGTGYQDWSHWLPCDAAVAIPSERHQHTLPYTRSIARDAGWQWRIPLQHRNGNGLVYSSRHYSQEQAENLLLNNLDTQAIGEPNHLRFTTGRRRQQWNKNVVAIGLSSGFLEPLESTSIHLIQSAIVRLTQLFPHQGVRQDAVDEYNRQSRLEFEQIRDFLILHYHLNARQGSQFWRELREMDIPDSLAEKINLFRATGSLFRQQNDLFLESSWLQVMTGQGITPQDYHPIVDNLSAAQVKDMLGKIKQIKQQPLGQLPSHDEFLRRYCGYTD